MWIRPVADANALFALRAALREVESLAKNGLTKEQFETTRKFLRKYCIHYAETTADRLGYAVDDRYYDIDEPPHQVSPDDRRAHARGCERGDS